MSFRDHFPFPFFAQNENKKTLPTQKRGLNFESLENREMLSASSPLADTTADTTIDTANANVFTTASTLATPNVTASVQADNTVRLTWGAISGAQCYDIWKIYNQGTNNESHVFLQTVTTTSYTHLTPNQGANTYAVIARAGENFSDHQKGVTVTVTSNLNLKGTLNADKTWVTLAWNKVPNATQYVVTYLHKDTTSSTTTMDSGTVTVFSNSYERRFPAGYDSGYYTVTAYNGAAPTGDFGEVTVYRNSSSLSTPKVTKYAQDKENVVLEWNTVTDASRYQICRLDSTGNEILLGYTDKTSYTVANATVGFNTYTVRAVDSSGNTSDYQRDVKVNVTFGVRATLLAGGNTVMVDWDKVTDAAYYTVWWTDEFGTEKWYAVNNEQHVTGQSVTITVPSSASPLTYGVRAFRSNGEYMGYGAKTAATLETPDVEFELISFDDESFWWLDWQEVGNAKCYEIWDVTDNPNGEFIARVTDTYFIVDADETNPRHYAVRAVADLASSDYKTNIWPFKSEVLRVPDGHWAYTWDGLPEWNYFNVYIFNENTDKWDSIGSNIREIGLILENPGIGDREYKVVAYDDTGKELGYSTAEFCYSDVADVQAEQSDNREITLSWTGGEGDYIQIFRNNTPVGSSSDIRIVDGTYFWTDKDLPTRGTGPFEYFIRVGFGDIEDETFYDSEKSEVVLETLEAPVLSYAKDLEKGTITLTWTTVPNAAYTLSVRYGSVSDSFNAGTSGTYTFNVPDGITEQTSFEFSIAAVKGVVNATSNTVIVGWPEDLVTTSTLAALGRNDTARPTQTVDEKENAGTPVAMEANAGTVQQKPAPTASQNDENIVVRWAATDLAVNYYTISVNNGSPIVVSDVNSGLATFEWPRETTAPIDYTFEVTAHYDDDVAVSSDVISYTWLGTPINVEASWGAGIEPAISVTWNDTVNASGAVRYKVTAYSASDDRIVDSMTTSSQYLLFTSTALEAGSSYYFTVCALGLSLDTLLGAESEASNTILF